MISFKFDGGVVFCEILAAAYRPDVGYDGESVI